MNTYKLEKDIPLFCLTAKSFPAGIQEAHQTLYRMVSFSPERQYYGLSRMDKTGDIVYKAAVAALTPGELSNLALEPFTLVRGDYIYTDIKNFRENIPAIGPAFDKLKTDKRMDPQGVAIEWYFNETDVRCMIKIK